MFIGNLEPTYRQLETMLLDKSPFIIISVIGQELLAQGSFTAAVQVISCSGQLNRCHSCTLLLFRYTAAQGSSTAAVQGHIFSGTQLLFRHKAAFQVHSCGSGSQLFRYTAVQGSNAAV